MKLPRLDQIPRTPDEMTALLLEAGRAGAYVKVSMEARRRRLTENDIAIIERGIIAEVTTVDPRIADEFTTFEVEPAFAQAKALLIQFFANAKVARVQDINKS